VVSSLGSIAIAGRIGGRECNTRIEGCAEEWMGEQSTRVNESKEMKDGSLGLYRKTGYM
jgi:hypothetical protein